MNYILKAQPSEIKSRPPIQSWQWGEPPEGFVFCPEEFIPVFTSAKGFVDITLHENCVVTSMVENTEAKIAWEVANPEKPPEPTPEEDIDNMLIELQYEITLLKLGIEGV